MKETFIIRSEWFKAIERLSVEDRAEFLNNLFRFHLDRRDEIKEGSIALQVLWDVVEPNLTRNGNEWDKRKLTSSENGKLGGRPRKAERIDNQIEKPKNNLTENLHKPNKPIVSVLDSVLVNDNDIPPNPEPSTSANAEIPSGEVNRPARKREPKKVWNHPTIDEVIAYFRAEGYTDAAANKFFRYYSQGEPPWHDSRGNPVKGWKQKAQSVWFKPENETKAKEIQATSGTRSEYVMGQRFNPRTGEPMKTT